jgi:hypothetical protein
LSASLERDNIFLLLIISDMIEDEEVVEFGVQLMNKKSK